MSPCRVCLSWRQLPQHTLFHCVLSLQGFLKINIGLSINTVGGFFINVMRLAVLAVILLTFKTALSNLTVGRGEEGRLRLEESIRRAAVTCYAVEGMYPPSLEYLVEHYGIQINEELYTVKYEIFASNLVPDITVLVN